MKSAKVVRCPLLPKIAAYLKFLGVRFGEISEIRSNYLSLRPREYLNLDYTLKPPSTRHSKHQQIALH